MLCSSAQCKCDQVSLLAEVELRLLAPQATLGPGYLQSVAGTQPEEVAFELGHHGQHVEQQPAHRVGRVVNGSSQAQLDLPAG